MCSIRKTHRDGPGALGLFTGPLSSSGAARCSGLTSSALRVLRLELPPEKNLKSTARLRTLCFTVRCSSPRRGSQCALERRHDEDQSACSTRAFIGAVGSGARPGRRIECSPLRPLVMTPRGRTRAGRIGAERIAPSPYRVLKASAACRGSLLLMMECALRFPHDKLFAWACSHHSAILPCVDLICL